MIISKKTGFGNFLRFFSLNPVFTLNKKLPPVDNFLIKSSFAVLFEQLSTEK